MGWVKFRDKFINKPIEKVLPPKVVEFYKDVIEKPVVQPVIDGVIHVVEEGGHEIPKGVARFFTVQNPQTAPPSNETDTVLSSDADILNGVAPINIQGATELVRVLIQIWKWQSDDNAVVSIRQPGANRTVRVRRVHPSTGENLWYLIEFLRSPNDFPFDLEKVNGDWCVDIPGTFRAASLVIAAVRQV